MSDLQTFYYFDKLPIDIKKEIFFKLNSISSIMKCTYISKKYYDILNGDIIVKSWKEKVKNFKIELKKIMESGYCWQEALQKFDEKFKKMKQKTDVVNDFDLLKILEETMKSRVTHLQFAQFYDQKNQIHG